MYEREKILTSRIQHIGKKKYHFTLKPFNPSQHSLWEIHLSSAQITLLYVHINRLASILAWIWTYSFRITITLLSLDFFQVHLCQLNLRQSPFSFHWKHASTLSDTATKIINTTHAHAMHSDQYKMNQTLNSFQWSCLLIHGSLILHIWISVILL